MTVVEKAAYLKGLVDGLGIEPDSRDGKLWNAVTELLSDMAHEIEDLQETDMDFAEALDDVSEELEYLEELTCDLDEPRLCEDWCDGSCEECLYDCEDEDDEDDEELDYDGILYDVECPVCGEELTFREEDVAKGSMPCPVCGELLEFDLSEDED